MLALMRLRISMNKSKTQHQVMQVRAAALSHYETVARKLGVNIQPLLRKVGLTRQMLVSPRN